MRKASAAAVLALLVALPSAAEAATSIQFADRALLDGTVVATGAQWLVARVAPGTELRLSFGPSRLVNTTVVYPLAYHGPFAGFETQPHSSNETVELLPSALTLTAHGSSSTLAIRLSAGNASTSGPVHLYAHEGHVGSWVMDGAPSHWTSWMLSADPGVAVVQEVQAASVRLGAEASAVEWFGMDVRCEAGISTCPSGGGREELQGSAGGVTAMATYRFSRVEGPIHVGMDGALTRFALGGERLDVAVDGAVHLPVASMGPCEPCPELDGQTLYGTGRFELNGLQRTESGMAATLSGTFTSARVDEAWVSAEQLGRFGAAAAATVGIGLLLKLLLAPLFTRLSKQEALEHPRRRTIFGYIQRHPGANFREVARNTGIASGTVRHHLTVLERSGHIVERPHNGTVRLFENHGKFDGNWSDVVLLREPALAELHGWIRQHPLSPQKDILEAMERMGWSRSTTQHRLVRLAQGGLVAIRLQGRLKIYSATPRAAPASLSFVPAATTLS